MARQRVFISLLCFFLFAKARTEKVLRLEQESPIERDITDNEIKISWNISLPPQASFSVLMIYAKVAGEDKMLSSTTPATGTTLISEDKLPDLYKGRLTATRNGIILTKLDFNADNDSQFVAHILYKEAFVNHTSHETSQPIRVLLRYPPEFIGLPKVMDVIEDRPGQITCIVKSNPKVKEVKWKVDNAAFKYSTHVLALDQSTKLQYGIDPSSRLQYTVNLLSYESIKRHHVVQPTCIAMAENGRTYSHPITFNIQYPPMPPSKVEVTRVTDRDAHLQWNVPPKSGNPSKIILYTVEYFKSTDKNPKPENDIGSRDNTTTNNESNHVNNVRQTPLKIYNISKENTALYELEPSSTYVVRVKSYNGAVESEPSKEVEFRTESSNYGPSANPPITQPMLIGIIAASTLLTLIIMAMAIVLLRRVKRKQTRTYAVFEHHKSITPSTPRKPQNSSMSKYKTTLPDSAFAHLPPPSIDPIYLESIKDIPSGSLRGGAVGATPTRSGPQFQSISLDTDEGVSTTRDRTTEPLTNSMTSKPKPNKNPYALREILTSKVSSDTPDSSEDTDKSAFV